MTPDGPPASERSIAVGRVTRAHGVRGEVAVLLLSEVEDRFASGARLFTDDGRRLTVAATRPHGERLLVTFEEIPDRATAEALASRYLLVPVSQVPALPEGAYWPHELEGCEVVTESGRSIGTISEVIHGPATDFWRTVGDGRETMVPALRDLVASVDISGRRVVVRDLPELLEEQ